MNYSFIVLLLLSVRILSAQYYSHCTIFCESGEKFTVYLNGEKKNEEPSDRVRIINLTQRYYSLKVVFEDGSIPAIERKVFNLQDAHGAPVDATFAIRKNNKGEMGIHWKSQTTYPEYIETNKPTIVVVNGGTQVIEKTTTTTTEPSNGVNVSFGVPGGAVNINTGSNSNTTQTTTTTTSVVNTNSSSNTLPCTGTILGESDFLSALNSIRNRSSIEGKMVSAKQIISNNCLSTMQVKSILHLFETEENRLELAIYAYSFTLDKGSYYKLNDVFKNESNIYILNKATLK